MYPEPVRIMSLLNAAILATYALVAWIAQLTPEATAVFGATLAAWVAVAGEIVRSKVTPTQKVALTKEEAAALTKVGL